MNSLAFALASPDRTAYADAVGFVRAREKRDLLNQARLQEFLSLDAEGFRERLGEGSVRDQTADFDIDALLGARLAADYAEVAAYDHQKLAVPVLRHRQDIHNLRSLIRKKLTGQPPRFAAVGGFFPVDVLEEAVFAGRRLPWPEPIGSTLRDVVEHADGRQEGDWLDLRLDLAWLDYALNFSLNRRMAVVAHYFKCLGDFAAVKYFWRRLFAARHHYEAGPVECPLHFLDEEVKRVRDHQHLADLLLGSPHGAQMKEGIAEWRATGSWVLLERDMDNYLLGILSGTKYISLGPEPLTAFLLARENDQKNIRTIYVLRKAGWPEGAVKKYLRRSYV